VLGAVRALDVLGVVRTAERSGPLTVDLGHHRAEGWPAVRALVRRVPLAWILLPVVYAVPSRVGDRWLHAGPGGTRAVRAAPRAPLAAVCVAAVLIAGNSLAGLGAVTAGWPFACYPTFAGIARTERLDIRLVLERPEGDRVILDTPRLRQLVNWEKFDGMAAPILRHEDDALRRARGLVELLRRAGIDIPAGTRCQVQRVRTALGRDTSRRPSTDLTFVVQN